MDARSQEDNAKDQYSTQVMDLDFDSIPGSIALWFLKLNAATFLSLRNKYIYQLRIDCMLLNIEAIQAH